MQLARFYGGPMHGECWTLRDLGPVQVAESNSSLAFMEPGDPDPDHFGPSYKTVIYSADYPTQYNEDGEAVFRYRG